MFSVACRVVDKIFIQETYNSSGEIGKGKRMYSGTIFSSTTVHWRHVFTICMVVMFLGAFDW